MSAATAVVHLVRRANGPEPFDAFMTSYERHPAGSDHDLVLLFKGFDSTDETEWYRRRAAGLVPVELSVPDDGMDLTAYLAAARRLPYHRLCFLNSFTTILAPGWLGLFARALDTPGAGAVGATGSWGSHRSFALSLLRLPNGYRGTLGDRAAMGPALRSLGPARELGAVRRRVRAVCDILREIRGYDGFPSPHLRTNAFLIERERLLSLAAGPLATKATAYRFEGGRSGLTGQLRKEGLTPLVVGRDGEPLPPERWPDAEIFWQGAQGDLLVADNQTRAYECGDPAQREALARYAWGPRARPG